MEYQEAVSSVVDSWAVNQLPPGSKPIPSWDKLQAMLDNCFFLAELVPMSVRFVQKRHIYISQ